MFFPTVMLYDIMRQDPFKIIIQINKPFVCYHTNIHLINPYEQY